MKILHFDQKSLHKVGDKGGMVSEEISNTKNIPINLHRGNRKDALRVSRELVNPLHHAVVTGTKEKTR